MFVRLVALFRATFPALLRLVPTLMNCTCMLVWRRFFNQKKYSSFQRQLNLYDFKRLSVGRDRGGKQYMKLR